MGPRMIWGKRDELVAGSGRRWHAAETSTVKSTTRGWHCDYSRYPLVFRAVPALFSLMLLCPFLCRRRGERGRGSSPAHARGAKGGEPQTFRNVSVPWRARRRRGVSSPLRRINVRHLSQLRRQPAPTVIMAQPVGPPVLPAPDLSEAAAKRPLNERVRELEIGWAAQRERDAPDHPGLALEDRTENQ